MATLLLAHSGYIHLLLLFSYIGLIERKNIMYPSQLKLSPSMTMCPNLSLQASTFAIER